MEIICAWCREKIRDAEGTLKQEKEKEISFGMCEKCREEITEKDGLETTIKPFCSYCRKKYRKSTTSGKWEILSHEMTDDEFLFLQGNITITHSCCPECLKRECKKIPFN
ncbi:MAG: hypothetical protein V1851_02990 [Patescibacteria group bacterium]